ncbi:PfkB family carbohydrate kinase [Oerskovia flava]|uniref:PfkB family carbohydrate kinase n=1 Tax=Oerskovia flava TaxID=2986422 RepID=UPI002AD2B2F5|nr:PfkB family carbohydrate kinase [Oerskovia sp. JB1-3-2]
MTRFLVVGEALVDVVPGPGGAQELPGGSPANVALTLGRLGCDVTLVTMLSDDDRGGAVRSWLRSGDVVVRATAPSGGRTSTARAELDTEGRATYELDVAWEIDDVDVAGVDVLHVGSVATFLEPGAEAVRDAVRRVRGRAVVALDPNIRPQLVEDEQAVRARVHELVALADVVKVSDEDLAWLAPGRDPAEIAREWSAWGASLVVVTFGGDGALLVRHDGRAVRVAGRQVDVVDTVGAGDTFMGALLDALAVRGVRGAGGALHLRGLSDAAVRTAARSAAVAASVTVSRAGANPPTRAELRHVEGPVLPPSLPGGPVTGMTWGWTGVRGTWTGPAADCSMDELLGLGADWVAVTFSARQDTAQSTRIRFADAPTVTDDEVRSAVRAAKARGWKVCLKPVVDSADGTWRAFIGFFDDDVPGEPTWSQWFDSYTQFVVHHARIAAEEGAEMFCVGCEMVRADGRDAEWRALIAAVREVYDGLVTYNCDKYQEDRVTWWDAVDVIGSSGYHPTGSWEQHLDRIESVVAREDKPFVFMEAGCPSRAGSPERPNDWTLVGEVSGDAQAAWLAEMFTACARRPWVSGVFLWDWPSPLYARTEAGTNDDYCVYGKPGAAVVQAAFEDMRSRQQP